MIILYTNVFIYIYIQTITKERRRRNLLLLLQIFYKQSIYIIVDPVEYNLKLIIYFITFIVEYLIFYLYLRVKYINQFTSYSSSSSF